MTNLIAKSSSLEWGTNFGYDKVFSLFLNPLKGKPNRLAPTTPNLYSGYWNLSYLSHFLSDWTEIWFVASPHDYIGTLYSQQNSQSRNAMRLVRCGDRLYSARRAQFFGSNGFATLILQSYDHNRVEFIATPYQSLSVSALALFLTCVSK